MSKKKKKKTTKKQQHDSDYVIYQSRPLGFSNSTFVLYVHRFTFSSGFGEISAKAGASPQAASAFQLSLLSTSTHSTLDSDSSGHGELPLHQGPIQSSRDCRQQRRPTTEQTNSGFPEILTASSSSSSRSKQQQRQS